MPSHAPGQPRNHARLSSISTASSGSVGSLSPRDSPERPPRTIRTDISRTAEVHEIGRQPIRTSGHPAAADRSNHLQERSDDTTRTVVASDPMATSDTSSEDQLNYPASDNLFAADTTSRPPAIADPSTFPLVESSSRSTRHKPRLGSVYYSQGSPREQSSRGGIPSGLIPLPTDIDTPSQEKCLAEMAVRNHGHPEPFTLKLLERQEGPQETGHRVTSSLERLSRALAAQTIETPADTDLVKPSSDRNLLPGLLPGIASGSLGSWARKWTFGLGYPSDSPTEDDHGPCTEHERAMSAEEPAQSEGEAAMALLRRLGAQSSPLNSRAGSIKAPATATELHSQNTGSSLWSWWGSLSGASLSHGHADVLDQTPLAASASVEDLDDQAAIDELLKRMRRCVSERRHC